MSWQPIETAPKDGSRLVLWCGRYSMPFFGAYARGFCTWVDDDIEEIYPTHWMQLSEPPK